MAPRPTDGAAQVTEGFVIRRMTAGDVDAVREVARTTWTAAYAEFIPEASRESFIERAYSREFLERRMERGTLLVGAWREGVIGFADFAPAGDGELELAALYVLPEAQGRGLGSRLMERGVEESPSARSVVLRVLRENVPAQRFYEARGFDAVGEYEWRLEGGDVLIEVEMVAEIRGRE